jgi:hypothetical protein
MHKYLASLLCALSILALSSPAFAGEGQGPQALELKVTRAGDFEMSCHALSQEALTMSQIINTTQDIKDESTMQSRGISAAGAVGSFIVGTATGGIGLAAAGLLLDHNVEEKADKADTVQDTAAQRRSLMMGIYNAKGCFGPIEHAMQDPKEHDPFSLANLAPASGEQDSERDHRTTQYNN